MTTDQMTDAELAAQPAAYRRPEDDLHAEAQVLLERGWISRDSDNRLWITEAGEQARVRMGAHAPAIRARIHEGIDDADYVTALKVLRQLIENTAAGAS
ncbi:hypothetical protein E1211_07635 [Micromonospora sp. 15K316]|uniref:hypothetical protein n=1 Tax=Micromonospora sp. 15K316 TaxID=2530376 RepID=UPI00104951CB|nr:hypothetical protein [Micromonospora sp. 15K316]TDC38295.1 hypothetical protein E1211_07635 [Micromonospora sp. 15K316]